MTWAENTLLPIVVARTDYSGIQYPNLTEILITSDCFIGNTVDSNAIYGGLPGTIILSPGFTDPAVNAYVGGSEPCRTTGSIPPPRPTHIAANHASA